MTNGQAPSWLELIVESTKAIDEDDKLLNQLFNLDTSGDVKDAKYELTICAQILEIEYKKKKKDLKSQVAEIIKSTVNDSTIEKGKLEELKEFFKMHQNINIITTNYDTLFSDYIIPGTSRVIIEGSVMPRINAGQNIYHIHGCTVKPESIVLTLNDYYNFQNLNNYFSRKFYTLLQETTVAIIGYSLGDFNLNTILSEVKNSKKESFRKTDIYYINKGEIPEVISKFYSLTYGIRTIQNKRIDQFFNSVETNYEKAKKLIESIGDLREVISGNKIYTDEFLKLRVSLPTILMQAAAMGIDTTNTDFLKTLLNILEKKREFTHETDAWVQYEHLADWLIEVASVVLIKSTMIEREFCELVKYSFKKSSRKRYKGYSWYAWKEWNSRWHEMKLENQMMLQELIETSTWDTDLEITELYK
ncbi:MAG TPA: SIR2 family protein [Ohtaekwangia sp.]|uniref:SIR2 family NAD-dependent protein deacylase n=1 Tax=Ohtaekwangia sp. TaxID=2066019 RepID=UPI002F93F3DE